MPMLLGKCTRLFHYLVCLLYSYFLETSFCYAIEVNENFFDLKEKFTKKKIFFLNYYKSEVVFFLILITIINLIEMYL